MSAERTAALLIHGLGGTQFDLGSMHKTLRRAGIDTHSLTLPGHGGQPEDLADVHAEQWLEAVRTKYREVAQQYDVVHVIGMCMGSLLALALCAQEKHERGKLVTLAPPIYIDGWATPWYRLARHLLYRIPLVPRHMRVDEDEPFGIKNALVRSIVKAKFARGDNFHYRWVPLACLREVDRLRRTVMRTAASLRCDTLVMHAREDELTSLRSAYFLRDRIERSTLVVLENSYHLICVDNDRERVASSVLDFLGLEANSAPASAEEADVPMSRDAVIDVARRYLSALTEQRFEAALPLFASNVVWEQRGEPPFARCHEGRHALVDLFSGLIERSGGTFALRSFDEPSVDGQTVRVHIRWYARHAGQTLDARAVKTITVRNGKIAKVVFEPDDVGADNAFWNGTFDTEQSRGKIREGALPDDLTALHGDALEARFAHAQAAAKQLPHRPSNDVLLLLYACFRQARDGDAPSERPSALDITARAKHDAWSRLAGVGADDARRRYIAQVEHLIHAHPA
jgi:carboxylesterase